EEIATGVEHIDKATAGTGNVIVSRVILQRICDEDFAIEISDAEWRIASRKVGIDEAIRTYLMKTLIVGFDVAGMEIRHKQEVVIVGDPERCAFINGVVNTAVRAVVHGDYSVRRIHGGVPT